MFRLTAESNLASAMHWLGRCYNYGRGIEKILSEAVKFFKLALINTELDIRKYFVEYMCVHISTSCVVDKRNWENNLARMKTRKKILPRQAQDWPTDMFEAVCLIAGIVVEGIRHVACSVIIPRMLPAVTTVMLSTSLFAYGYSVLFLCVVRRTDWAD